MTTRSGYVIRIVPSEGISLQVHTGRIKLAQAQALVGGDVEVVHGYFQAQGIELIANENGIGMGLKASPLYGLVGPVAIVGAEPHDEDGIIWTALDTTRLRRILAELGVDEDHARAMREAAREASFATGASL